MNPQQLIIYVIVIVVAFASYNSWRVKNRIYATFTRRDNSERHKWVRAKNGERLEFDSGWYYVVAKCVRYDSLDSGFNMLFPATVRKLYFSYKSKWPIDPETGEPLAETPEMRKNLNKREDIEALEVGARAAMGKAKAGLMGGGLMPVILIIGIVGCGYFLYQLIGRVDALGQALNVLQSMMMKAGIK